MLLSIFHNDLQTALQLHRIFEYQAQKDLRNHLDHV